MPHLASTRSPSYPIHRPALLQRERARASSDRRPAAPRAFTARCAERSRPICRAVVQSRSAEDSWQASRDPGHRRATPPVQPAGYPRTNIAQRAQGRPARRYLAAPLRARRDCASQSGPRQSERFIEGHALGLPVGTADRLGKLATGRTAALPNRVRMLTSDVSRNSIMHHANDNRY
jgi:hypothetical protein